MMTEPLQPMLPKITIRILDRNNQAEKVGNGTSSDQGKDGERQLDSKHDQGFH